MLDKKISTLIYIENKERDERKKTETTTEIETENRSSVYTIISI